MKTYDLTEDSCMEENTRGDHISLEWKGSLYCSDETCDILVGYLDDINKKIKDQKLLSFTVDFRGLVFMNSSGIKVLIRWMQKLERELDYKITVWFDPGITWQDVTFYTFKNFMTSVDFKTVKDSSS